MLEMGTSHPWPDELTALSGEPTMDAGAILEYFAPLKKWLDVANKGQVCGWSGAGRRSRASISNFGETAMFFAALSSIWGAPRARPASRSRFLDHPTRPFSAGITFLSLKAAVAKKKD